MPGLYTADPFVTGPLGLMSFILGFILFASDHCNALGLLVDVRRLSLIITASLECGCASCYSDTRKFDRGLRQLMRVDLHWLELPERVKFKLVSMLHNCLDHKAPRGNWPTTAFQSLTWPVDDIFVLPGVITSLCLDTVSALMGVGHLWLTWSTLSTAILARIWQN